MKRSILTSSLVALGVAFLIPMGAQATTTTATASKHATAAKTASAAKQTSATTTAKTDTPAKTATATKTTRHHVAKNASAPKKAKIDINSATREELMTLPGMDGDMADKVIAGRPYKNSAQLKTKGGVTNAEYRKISSKVTARQSTMHSEAPASGTPSTDSGSQASGSEGAAGSSGSADNTTK